MNAALRETISTALTLVLFSVIGAGLLSGTFGLTYKNISKSEEAEKLAKLSQTLPAGLYDNDLVHAARPLPADPLLGLKEPGHAYLATRADKPVAVILEDVAPDGYAGDIRLLVGILTDGEVAGVRVTAEKETPGLGDYIKASKSDWIKGFDGRSLGDPPEALWKVRKDGGRFDYMAGATISPRAVVKAVRNALVYFKLHRKELLAPAAVNPSEAQS